MKPAIKTIQKSVLIWYSPAEMFNLVTDVAQYPQFLPWCDKATIMESTEEGMTAEIGISFSGIRQKFTTQNIHHAPSSVVMTLINGPFSRLDGEWLFKPVGDGSQRACKVELLLNYGFSSATLGALIGPVFDKIASTMVDSFIKRAQQVYG